tara:strand:+ start:857 stop:1057 length:201 start_codon:yes stop_codon:yes gene_type:complete
MEKEEKILLLLYMDNINIQQTLIFNDFQRLFNSSCFVSSALVYHAFVHANINGFLRPFSNDTLSTQ